MPCLLTHSPDDTDHPSLRAQGELGLHVLNALIERHGAMPDTATLIAIAAFANSNDTWSTASSAALAQRLLDDHFRSPGDRGEEQRTKFITEDVLTGFLRPLFSKSHPATVTASGRKAEFVELSRYDGGDDAAARKPWKYERRYAVPVFEWAVEQSDVGSSFHHGCCSSRPYILYSSAKSIRFLPVHLFMRPPPYPTILPTHAHSHFRSLSRTS